MCGPRLMAFHPIASGLLPLECRPPIIQRRHTHARAHRELENSTYMQLISAMHVWYVYVCLPARNPDLRVRVRVECVRVLTPCIGRFCAPQSH